MMSELGLGSLSVSRRTLGLLTRKPQRSSTWAAGRSTVTSIQHRHVRELCPRRPSDGREEAGLASGRKALTGGGYTLEHRSSLDGTKTLGPAGQGPLAWRELAAEGEAAWGWSL